MSTPIARLFGLIVVLFLLLIVWTLRWTVFQASSLNNNPLNVRTLIDELHIKRGRILAADGTVLAKSVPAPDDTWSRTYPLGRLFAQPVGYSIAAKGEAAGLEESAGSDLRGYEGGHLFLAQDPAAMPELVSFLQTPTGSHGPRA